MIKIKNFLGFFLSCLLLGHSFGINQTAWAEDDQSVIKFDAAILVQAAENAYIEVQSMLSVEYRVLFHLIEAYNLPSAKQFYRKELELFRKVCGLNSRICRRALLFSGQSLNDFLSGQEVKVDDTSWQKVENEALGIIAALSVPQAEHYISSFNSIITSKTSPEDEISLSAIFGQDPFVQNMMNLLLFNEKKDPFKAMYRLRFEMVIIRDHILQLQTAVRLLEKAKINLLP